MCFRSWIPFKLFQWRILNVIKSPIVRKTLEFTSSHVTDVTADYYTTPKWSFKFFYITFFFYHYRSDVTRKPWPLAGSQSTPSSLASSCQIRGIIWQQVWVVLKVRLQRLWFRELPWSGSGKAASLLMLFLSCVHPRHRSSQAYHYQWMEGSISSNLTKPYLTLFCGLLSNSCIS